MSSLLESISIDTKNKCRQNGHLFKLKLGQQHYVDLKLEGRSRTIPATKA